MKSKVIAIDFDGTIVTDKFPEVGDDIGATRVIKRLQDCGHKIILYTMRAFESDVNEDTISEAIEFCESKGIEFFGINHNPDQESWNQSPKIYADLYIDDRSAMIPLLYDINDNPYVNWSKVEMWLEENGYFL